MKKIFIAVLAVAALASCSKEQTINVDKGEAISFDTFVENSTRANDLVANNFNFGVYGSVINSQNQQGMIFTNEEVANDGSYGPVQYWIAGANYEFVAIAPYTGAAWTYAPTVATAAENGTITFNNENAAANQDLIFAAASKTTDAKLTQNPGKVGFTFNHMLSRVRFTFANGFGEGSNIKLQVYDVTITDAYATAKLAVEDGTPADDWSNFSGTLSKNFGKVGGATLATLTDTGATMSAATEHFYLIPANKAYTVTFKVDLYQAGVKLDTYERTATIPATDMQKGMSYDIKTTLNAQNTSDDGKLWPIEFEVKAVTEWDSFGDGDITGTVNQPTTGNN